MSCTGVGNGDKEESLGRKMLNLRLDMLGLKVLMGHSSVAINGALRNRGI